MNGPLFPTPLDQYPVRADLLATLMSRATPTNVGVLLVFALAVLHTFACKRFMVLSRSLQERQDAAARAAGRDPGPSVAAEALHFLGEVEVVFGLWTLPLIVVITGFHGWASASAYLNETVHYTEALFVFVIMALASTRPIVALAEGALRRVAGLGGGTPGAWWLAILVLGPLLGSLITEPAAMTICALLLGRRFYALKPSPRLAYATLGLLFVNVSLGGTLSHFAAPPVLVVASAWNWSFGFMLANFGATAALAISLSSLVYWLAFRREFGQLQTAAANRGAGGDERARVPIWVTLVHLVFMAWTVVQAHHPALFLGGFLFFLGFAKATSPYQSPTELRSPLLVGFFLAGLVIHGGLQGWWIAPLLASLTKVPLFFGAVGLTAFNDNALITYLATLVPDLSEPLKHAVVAGAVTGGGLTVIANAPNPAGQAILAEHFEDGISPFGLATGALLPTAIASLAFLLL